VSEQAASVDEVLRLFDEWGQDRYDEAISQLDHALQTAALARRDGAGDELVAAALLHDVGHLLHLRSGGTVEDGTSHERRGARYLAGLFPRAVTGPIALHVQAKRYRCAVDPGYHASLSEGSTRSLERQGGPFASDEVAAFERRLGAKDAVRLREWDDAGKVEGLDVDPLDAYRELLERVSRQPASGDRRTPR
jgi:phosphonate degradation associated HDIG domain protein